MPIRLFIRSQRLRKAAELIASTDRRISEICFLVGFTDASNFNHSFKREFEVSPRDYRKMLQQQPLSLGPGSDRGDDGASFSAADLTNK